MNAGVDRYAKRLIDVVLAVVLLLVFSPLILVLAIAIFSYDRCSPLYIAERIGQNGRPFGVVKLRSMVVNADKLGGSSTASSDKRITPVGRFVRVLKLDEITQFWNVLTGDMSIVGPRPNVAEGVAVYTHVERRLLDVRPGVTDFASIVFADEGEILSSHQDVDKAYNELIRPWKNRLALFYLDHRSILVDARLIVFTAVAMLSRPVALKYIVRELSQLGAPEKLIQVASRSQPLVAASPPGSPDSVGEFE